MTVVSLAINYEIQEISPGMFLTAAVLSNFDERVQHSVFAQVGAVDSTQLRSLHNECTRCLGGGGYGCIGDR